MWKQVSQALDQSFTRVMTRIASLLPGFLALLVALLVSALVAWAIGFLLRRSLRSLDFDRKATRWGLPGFRGEVDRSPTEWAVRIVTWTIIVVGFLVGVTAARFLSRSVLIGAVNLNVQYAHLLSLGMKWLILVLTGAMALNHLEIGGTIVDEAFAILFGGIVLTLALAVGLGARDLVSRSLERQAGRMPEETTETFRHF
jgi:hypothetical protein